jgi:hypothetical protein
MPTYKILILGASYGSLLATKLLLAGHTVKMVCLPAEADLFNSEGAIVRMPIKGREGLVEIRSRDLPGKLSAGGPDSVNPADYDLIALAMQEPQYRSPGVRELLDKVKGWQDRDEWPGRYPTPMQLGKPRWMEFDEEEGATEGLVFGASNNEEEDEDVSS